MTTSGAVFAARSQMLRTLARRGNARAAARLLPASHIGWRDAAAAMHGEVIELLAARHGVSPAEYRAELLVWLRHRTEVAETRIRMKPHQFDLFVRDERYKSEFEVPGTSGGARHRGVRLLLEHTVLGVPPDALASDRPVYGYLEGSDEEHPFTQQYGPVVLRLNDELRLRSTLTLGDSLDLAVDRQFPDPCFIPMPLTGPGTGVFPLHVTRGIDPLEANLLHEASPHPYAEVQVFGGIRLADVREVVCTMGYELPSSTREHLRRSHVQVIETLEMTP